MKLAVCKKFNAKFVCCVMHCTKQEDTRFQHNKKPEAGHSGLKIIFCTSPVLCSDLIDQKINSDYQRFII